MGKTGHQILGIQTNTILTMIVTLLVGAAGAYMREMVQYVRQVPQIAKDINDVRLKGSVPLQQVIAKLNATVEDVQAMKKDGTPAMRERVSALEAEVQAEKEYRNESRRTLGRIEAKIDAHISGKPLSSGVSPKPGLDNEQKGG